MKSPPISNSLMIERDNQGRFALGNQGGPGRPRRDTEQEYLTAFSEVISLKDWMEIIQRAVTQAKRGDARARQWLTNYIIGTPEKLPEEPCHSPWVEVRPPKDYKSHVN